MRKFRAEELRNLLSHKSSGTN